MAEATKQALTYPLSFTFNTGRNYSPAGQEIEATVKLQEPFDEFGLAEARAAFKDVTRGVSGYVTFYVHSDDKLPQVQRELLRRYDMTDYTPQ